MVMPLLQSPDGLDERCYSGEKKVIQKLVKLPLNKFLLTLAASCL